jgi:hypothetical protein
MVHPRESPLASFLRPPPLLGLAPLLALKNTKPDEGELFCVASLCGLAAEATVFPIASCPFPFCARTPAMTSQAASDASQVSMTVSPLRERVEALRANRPQTAVVQPTRDSDQGRSDLGVSICKTIVTSAFDDSPALTAVRGGMENAVDAVEQRAAGTARQTASESVAVGVAPPAPSEASRVPKQQPGLMLAIMILFAADGFLDIVWGVTFIDRSAAAGWTCLGGAAVEAILLLWLFRIFSNSRERNNNMAKFLLCAISFGPVGVLFLIYAVMSKPENFIDADLVCL